MKKFRYLWILGLIVFDQLIKLLIRKNMYVGETFAVIDRIFSITYVQNRGFQSLHRTRCFFDRCAVCGASDRDLVYGTA